MYKLIVSTRLPALIGLMSAAIVISVSANDKPQAKSANAVPVPPELPESSAGDQLILKALDEPTDLDFVETPLMDVVKAISTRHKNIPIQLYDKALADAGASPSTPITFQLRGHSLRYTLRLLLLEHDLDFVLFNGGLLVTSLEKPTTLRKYEVSDLLHNGVSIEKLGEAARFVLPRVSTDNPVPDGEVVPFDSVLLVRSNYRGYANVETFLAELRYDKKKHDAKTPAEK